jgi:hypothetical protein
MKINNVCEERHNASKSRKCTVGLMRTGLAVLTLALVTGCGTMEPWQFGLGPQKHPAFTEDNVAKLTVGMSTAEVLALFGAPDQQEVRRFGDKTASGPWSGRVYIYRMGKRDPEYETLTRELKNELVFCHGEATLNHWQIEVTYPNPPLKQANALR